MGNQTSNRSKLLVPISLVIVGLIVNGIAYGMGAAEEGGSLDSTRIAVETMARLSVLLVLGGLLCGLSAYCCRGGE